MTKYPTRALSTLELGVNQDDLGLEEVSCKNEIPEKLLDRPGVSFVPGLVVNLVKKMIVFRLMTNKKIVFRLLTNERRVLRVLTNERPVLPDPAWFYSWPGGGRARG